MSDIGRNIARIRKEKKWTQEELAARLHITRQCLSSWKRGRTQPDMNMLEQLSVVLEVPVEELISGEKRAAATTKGTVQGSVNLMTCVGAALAVVLSYLKWQSIPWAILHGGLHWFYVIYYAIKY